MTQTLRRELRLKFEEVLHRGGALWSPEKLAEELADAALALRAFKFKPQTIFAGVPDSGCTGDIVSIVLFDWKESRCVSLFCWL